MTGPQVIPTFPTYRTRCCGAPVDLVVTLADGDTPIGRIIRAAGCVNGGIYKCTACASHYELGNGFRLMEAWELALLAPQLVPASEM